MKSSRIWQTPHGSIALLPERGRVHAIEFGGHQALWSPKEISAEWNLGGERLWIGPEAEWFWKKTDKVDFENYQVPPALDPDVWTVTDLSDHHCRAAIQFRLACASGKDRAVEIALQRDFALLPGEASADDLPSIGIQMTTRLEILGGTPGVAVDLWSILQVPLGGEMQVPVTSPPAFRDYFSPCPSSETSTHAGLFRVRIGGRSTFKIGLPPPLVSGRIAYVRPVPGGTLTLQRSFPVHPEMKYCDAPLSDPASQGDAAQIFCDDGTFGGFGEMEHRSPAIVCGVGPQTLSETTVTRASFTPA